MKYIQATASDAEQIAALVQRTIQTIYPKYYPKEVVDFFLNLHSYENIRKDINGGCVGILIKDGKIVGTGQYQGNHITRVYVDPDFQGNGCGSHIMDCLEDAVGRQHNKVVLDSSLPACRLYEKRGYRTIKHEWWPVANGVILVYEVMEKVLP